MNEEYTFWCKQVKSCKKCDLWKTRKNVVISDKIGKHYPIMFVGEAPGKDEDEQGIPFVGRSGKYLRKVITKIGLSEYTYITNIVKCRPPNNRDPKACEINTCGFYVIEEIKYIQPKVIVGIGRISSGIMMRGYFQKMHHGQIFDKGKYKFMGTYHPAASLRNPEWDILMKNDLQKLVDFI